MPDVSVNSIIEYSNAIDSAAKLILHSNRPLTEFFLKEFNLPNVSISPQEVSYPENSFRLPGNVKTFGDLSAQIFMDEKHLVYKELYDWMIESITNTDKLESKINGTILVTNSQKTQSLVSYDFTGIFPTGLSEFTFNNYANTNLILNVSFSFDSFKPKFSS